MKKYHSLVRLIGLASYIFALALSSNFALAANFTLDFEDGTLRGWQRTGNAFNNQPTLGDNPTARNRGQASNHEGRYWIGTYENYQGRPGQTPGAIQGDRPTGTLTSSDFTIPSGTLSFLIGGGKDFSTRVALYILDPIEGPIRVYHASGNNNESMQRISWDLSPHSGKRGRIRIVDEASGPWGHINVDDFRFSATSGAAVIAPGVIAPAIVLPKKVAVPDITNRNQVEATAILRKSGLLPGKITENQSRQRAGTVISQNPPPRAQVIRGSRVDMVIAIPIRVRVPPLIRLTPKQARERLKQYDLVLGRITERATDEQPSGLIVAQEPEPRREVTIGSAVNVIVAIPAPQVVVAPVRVPRLIGQQKNRAIEILAEHNLRVGGVEERNSNEKAGTVIDQNPRPRTQVNAGAYVQIIVAGRVRVETPPSFVIVPRLIGQQKDRAIKILTEKGLRAGGVEERNSNEKAGTVIGQNPRPGARVNTNAYVQIIVARRVRVEPPPSFVIVPKLIGQQKDRAIKILTEKGLRAGGVEERISNEKAGTVIDQNPRPGARVNSEAYVQIFVARSDKIAPPVKVDSVPPDKNYLAQIIFASVGALVIFGSATAYAKFRYKGKRKSITKLHPDIKLKPTVDFGKSYVESTSDLDSEIDIRLRLVSDIGRQEVSDESKLIEEDN